MAASVLALLSPFADAPSPLACPHHQCSYYHASTGGVLVLFVVLIVVVVLVLAIAIALLRRRRRRRNTGR